MLPGGQGKVEAEAVIVVYWSYHRERQTLIVLLAATLVGREP